MANASHFAYTFHRAWKPGIIPCARPPPLHAGCGYGYTGVFTLMSLSSWSFQCPVRRLWAHDLYPVLGQAVAARTATTVVVRPSRYAATKTSYGLASKMKVLHMLTAKIKGCHALRQNLWAYVLRSRVGPGDCCTVTRPSCYATIEYRPHQKIGLAS